MIEITFEQNREMIEYMILKQQTKAVRMFRIFGFVLILCGILFAISELDFTLEEIDIALLISPLLLIGLGLYFLFGSKKLLSNSVKKQLDSHLILNSKPVIIFQFNENNFKCLSTSKYGMEESIYSYEVFTQFVEYDQFLSLKLASNLLHLIPKSCTDKETMINIIELLKTKIPNYRRCE